MHFNFPRTATSMASGLRCFRCERFIAQKDVKTELLCECGGPLLQQYELSRLSRGDREALKARPWGLWRYRELLPVEDKAHIVSLCEGGTPLIELPAMGDALDVRQLAVKDEGRNPTGTFKARGASVGVSRLAELGVKLIAMPTVGSGGSAWSAYAAKARIDILVGLPQEGNLPAIAPVEAALYGAGVVKVPGYITDAFKTFRAQAAEKGATVAGAFLEPYRLEGEKTIGYEIAEQFAWSAPDWIVWPTGGGVGLVGLAKAFRELKELGWLEGPFPGFVSVQVAGCSPVVDMIMGPSNNAAPRHLDTVAPGIAVPTQPFGDLLRGMTEGFRMLGAAVSDREILADLTQVARQEGVLLSPEGAAGVAAVRTLRARKLMSPGSSVVVVNTATGLRYPEVLSRLALDGKSAR